MGSAKEPRAAAIVLVALGAASRTRSMLTLASLAIVGALGLGAAAATAVAKPSRLDLGWEVGSPHPVFHQLERGQPVNFYSKEVTVTTREGAVNCSGEPLEGGRYSEGVKAADETNDEATDQIVLGAPFGPLRGAFS